jgi:hypothetical protein
MFREDVAQAWREVKANAGSAGVDGQTIDQIEEQGVEGLLTELATELREDVIDRKRCDGCTYPSQTEANAG